MKTIRIEADGGVVLSNSVRITNAETGEKIPGVRAVQIDLTIGQFATANLQIGPPSVSIARAKAGFSMIDPTDGQIKSVKAIQFVDGSTWEADGASLG